MAREYTIPELIRLSGIRGYTPRLSGAINTLLNSTNEIEYQEALKVATIEVGGYQINRILESNDVSGYSEESHFEGIPIYMPLLLEGFDQNTDDLLLDSAIISLNRPRKIVMTDVQGRDESVKEFINNGSWQISVSGILCDKGLGYPKDQVKNLNKFCTAKMSLKVVHEVLNMLDIHEVVVTDYSFPSSEMVNAQPYTMSLASEKPVELRLEE